MLTIDDIRNPKRKSGFDHVGASAGGKLWQANAYGGNASKAGHAWWGPSRASAEQAAQDYCDWYNTQPPLTIDDIRNPKKRSGFDFVNDNTTAGRKTRRFQAQKRIAPGSGTSSWWRGPTRHAAEEAAQDYCDYVNAQRPQQSSPTPRLKTAGHTGKRDPIADDPEVQAALGVLRDARGQRQGRQGYVYLIYEMQPGGGLRYGKIGYSTNPEARVAELQTGNPRPLKLGYAMPGTMDDEKRLHDKYNNLNVLQEWFEITKELILEFPTDTQGNGAITS